MGLGGGKVEDNSAEVARINNEEAARARQEQAAKEAQQKQEFDQLLEGVYSSSLNSANDYFTSQGLDPSQYQDAILKEAQGRRTTVPSLSGNPGAFFDGLGENVFNSLQSGERNKNIREIDKFAGTGFARDRISDTVDDPHLAGILDETFGKSKAYYDNLLSRGVINDAAYKKSIDDLTGQRGGAGLKLEDIGNATLETGRGSLRDIASEGRQQASNLTLGSAFDPNSFATRIDDTTQSFFTTLGDRLRSSAPSDLFDTSNLSSLVGQGSGAQNTKFDPRALAGLNIDEESEDDDENIFASSAF